MDEAASEIRKLLRQQAAIADFGSFALRQDDLRTVLTEAARVCANGLGVPFSKVCRYRARKNDLLVEAGYGWKPGVVGLVASRADASSPQGRAFTTGKPLICNDLLKEASFALPYFYAEHGIRSTIDVVIPGADKPYGVLEIDTDVQHDYDQNDINFVTSFANVLAEAVDTHARTRTMQNTIEQMRSLIDDKDRLLEQKSILAEEMQHRVRNNLQVIYGLLNRQLEHSSDVAGQQGTKAILRRVATLATAYDHLLSNELNRTTDFGSYVTSLCGSLAEVQGVPANVILLSCESDALMLDLDVVTALGVIVTELVTNSYEHAFPSSRGVINVTVRRPTAELGMACMVISDNGNGFKVGPTNKRHGLGLVGRLAEQIGGTATVNSDHGTVWTIHIPVHEALAP